MVKNTTVTGLKNCSRPQSSESIDYAYTDTNWIDKMTEYNGQTITYDEIGNPLTYRDGMTMTWKRGRQLTTLQTAENSIQYKYDSDSIRTSKIVDGVVHTYEYLGGLLMHETRGEQAYDYYYDANGQLYAVSYKLSDTDTKKVYYFTHNWRGDIVGIYNGNGDLKATYSYDAWGNVTAIKDASGNAITSATHIANLNPFRYRGYYQDTETGLYYLLSRYYDPVTHRFVNADGYFQSGGSLLDTNMNAYCGNNPVNNVDPTGEFWIAVALVTVIIATVAVTLSGDSSPQVQKSAETTKRNRIEEKKKTLKDKVNVYPSNDKTTKSGYVNVSINSGEEPNIRIQDSYQITDYYEMVAIMEITMESPLYDDEIFPRDVSSYVHEWKAHNILYSISSKFPLDFLTERFKTADLDNGDRFRFIWDLL